MKTPFAQRLGDFVHHTRLKDVDFAKSIDITKANLYNYLQSTEEKKKGTPHVDVIMRLLNKYPELNAYWLLCGKGEMLNIDDNNVNESKEQYVKVCKECKNKQNVIDQLSDYNNLLKQDLSKCRSDLQQIIGSTKSEKRKVG